MLSKLSLLYIKLIIRYMFNEMYMKILNLFSISADDFNIAFYTIHR